MKLAAVDWIFIVWYFILSIGIGLYYSKKAGKSISEYFLSGRSLPWWLLGTSMVATTFSSDTPLAVTGIVIKDGVSGNWFWWNFMLGSALTVLFFAHLWRRAEVVTEVEFIDIRYSGRAARFLRGAWRPSCFPKSSRKSIGRDENEPEKNGDVSVFRVLRTDELREGVQGRDRRWGQ